VPGGFSYEFSSGFTVGTRGGFASGFSRGFDVASAPRTVQVTKLMAQHAPRIEMGAGDGRS
jgi:hypothetical protein